MKYNINNVVLVCNTSGNCYDFVLFWNLQCPLAFHFRTDSNKMWFLKRWWKKWKVNEIALAKVLLFDNLLFRKTPSSQTFSDVSVVFFTHFWSIDSDFRLKYLFKSKNLFSILEKKEIDLKFKRSSSSSRNFLTIFFLSKNFAIKFKLKFLSKRNYIWYVKFYKKEKSYGEIVEK